MRSGHLFGSKKQTVSRVSTLYLLLSSSKTLIVGQIRDF